MTDRPHRQVNDGPEPAECDHVYEEFPIPGKIETVVECVKCGATK